MDEMEGVVEQQLMRGVIESETKKQIDGNKQDGKTGNVTVPRKIGIQAGNGITKERENMQISHEGIEESEINDRPEVSQLRSNKRK